MPIKPTIKRIKTQDFAQLGHDLRNVLSVIYSNAQLLELLLERAGMEEEREVAHTVVESAEDMNTIINERIARQHV
jgi:signal transduction histidine kinase